MELAHCTVLLLHTCNCMQCNYTIVFCSRWVVVVTSDKTVTPSQIPDSNLLSYTESNLLSYTGSNLLSYTESIVQIMYVAVVMVNTVEDQWEKSVTLGSGNTTTWNGRTFYNAPLRKDVSYYVFIRAYTTDHVDSVSQ